ncbi:MAG: 4-oxalocrotonate tautomerase family protein [Thermoleophilia bacterium]|nr:4-oxalocrotonate tautomerase family protein [Thermoleophilia bacterium]
MPFVEVKLYEGRSREQKEALVDKITEAFVEIAGTPKEHVWIVFRDVPKEQWAMNGELQG